jgi:hypothetical protein
LRHYLIVSLTTRTVVHHERAADGSFHERPISAGLLRLDPPGISLDIGALFAQR